MKYIWEINDIKVGRIVTKAQSFYLDAVEGWTAKWTKKIGYINHSIGKDDTKNYVLIDMTDGMVSNGMTKEFLVTYLNTNEMAPMPNEKVIELMEYLKKTNEG